MKKNIIFLMALLCLICSRMLGQGAEPTVAKNFTQIFDEQFKGNIADVPYGVLYNRVFGWSGLNNDVQEASKSRMVQAWLDLYSSSYNFNGGLSYKAFKEQLVNYELNKTKIPLIAINYNYGVLDASKLDSLSLGIDSLGNIVDSFGNYATEAGLLSTNPIKAKPYKTQTISLAGLYADELEQGEEVSIIWDDLLLLQNTDLNIKSIKIYDGEVLLGELNKNKSQLKINFESDGEKVLKFLGSLSDGRTLACTQSIGVKAKKLRADCSKIFHDTIASTIPFKGYNEAEATTTYIDYHIYYKFKPNSTGDCDSLVTKPIFFLDGFDAQDKRDYREIYFDKITTDQKTKPGNLASDLRKRGFDLIIVNFPKLGDTITTLDDSIKQRFIPQTVETASGSLVNIKGRDGGTDFVERNAMAVVELIKK